MIIWTGCGQEAGIPLYEYSLSWPAGESVHPVFVVSF